MMRTRWPRAFSVAIDVVANDTDADGTVDATTVTIVTDVTNGSTAVNPTTGVVTYTHDGSETTSDSFTYTVDDNNGATSNTATVTITVTPVNDPPVANDDADTVAEGASVDIAVVANDTDADGTVDATTVTIDTDVTNGTTLVNPTTGVVTYTHDGSETTSDSFTYTVDDNNGATSNTATVTITVTPVNDPPVANDDADTVVGGGQRGHRRGGERHRCRRHGGCHHGDHRHGRDQRHHLGQPDHRRGDLHPRRFADHQRQLHLHGERRPGRDQQHRHGQHHGDTRADPIDTCADRWLDHGDIYHSLPGRHADGQRRDAGHRPGHRVEHNGLADHGRQYGGTRDRFRPG